MTEAEQLILEKLSTMEEAIKLLLVNDVLKDAEKLAGQDLKHPVQQNSTSKTEEMQKKVKTLNARIKTLQELSESKDRTIKAKEERIQLLQKATQDLKNQLEAKKKKENYDQYINRKCILRTQTVYEDNTALRQKCTGNNAVGKEFIIDDYDNALGMYHIIQNTNKKKRFHFWVNIKGVNIL